MKIRHTPLVLACALMGAAAATTTARAEAVTYYFGGELGGVQPLFPTGTAFAGSFTYESTSPDLQPSSTVVGEYDTGMTAEVTIAGLRFSGTSPCATCGGISILKLDLLLIDGFTVSSKVADGATVDGATFTDIRLQVTYDFGTFKSDALPTTTLTFSPYQDLTFFSMTARNASGPFVGASGELNYFSLSNPAAVPESSTSAMLALGLGALAFARRRKGR